MNASAASIPVELPRHLAKFSTAFIERLCGQGLISDLYAFKAFNFFCNVSDTSIKQFGLKKLSDETDCQSVLEGTSKQQIFLTDFLGSGLHAVITA